MAKQSRSRDSPKDSAGPLETCPDAAQPTSDSTHRSTSQKTSAQPGEHGRGNLASGPSEIEVNRRPPIRMSADGLLEEQPSDWPKSNSNPLKDDPRTLAELAADVMKAAAEASTADESLRPGELSDVESRPANQHASEPTDDAIGDDAGVADVPELASDRSRNRWAALIVVIIVLLAAGGSFLWFDPSIGRLGADSGVDRESAATTDGAAASDAAGGGTPSEDESSPVAAKEPAPIPAADSEPLGDPISEPSPEPVAIPIPTPAPTSTVAPAPRGAHVADLVASTKEIGKRVKVSVEIHVHDSAHNPVAGATVRGQWSGDIGSASCVTGQTGSCAAQTGPLASPGSVTFTVAGIADAGEPYEPILNHDRDGDSNGTSITVRF